MATHIRRFERYLLYRAQSFEVNFPQNFTCENCTMRLLRQADEWNSNYRFWSCSDIDIKSRKWREWD